MPTESVTIPRELYAFLLGSADIDGKWFGDMNDGPGPRGRFWWRTLLRKCDKARYFVAGPLSGMEGGGWAIFDRQTHKVVEYVDEGDEAVSRCAELNAGASPTPA